ncbi:glycosyltransferase [Gluconacetobacter takamatsuzukensis]|uniref:Glycosyltransferase n=1 Tax=Gluconacetobacter takamatsuzukensis TaxID=1286190 RepID=A0A7W4KG58_9PROT|nr:glycosyltransferase [Gluconacetobacter takamatsuzukensis]MBB2206255.1 glycosyltransferase [Gluconacetobacter takamatsuzukensis]
MDQPADQPALKRAWWQFDAAWYRTRYAVIPAVAALRDEADILAFYRECGEMLGHSPNPFFDEEWYRQTYPDVEEAIQAQQIPSGFAHYRTEGFRDRDPNPFFDESFYRDHQLGLSLEGLEQHGLRNGYDHFLSYGAGEGRDASLFFSTKVFLAENPDFLHDSRLGPFVAFMENLHAPENAARRTSWFFDAAWYLRAYPAAAERMHEWGHPLRHYLINATPAGFAPLPSFSEAFYTASHPDVAAAVAAGDFRNGYAHFLRYGQQEARRPHPRVDLAAYAQDPGVIAALAQGRYPTPFAAHAALSGKVPEGEKPADTAELSCRRAFRLLAEARTSALLAHPIDFSCDLPALSVVMVVHNQFSFTMTALSSLRATYRGPVQVIVIDSGSRDETTRIARHVHGLDIIRMDENIGFLAGSNAGLARVVAPHVLFLNNDVELLPGAIDAALRRLRLEARTGAVGAKLVRTTGRLQEAGSIIWNDGTTSGYLRDASPSCPEANYTRAVDFCSGAFLMVRTELAKALHGFDPHFSPAYYEDTDLCVRIRRQGFDVIYDPDVTVLHYESGSGNQADIDTILGRNIGRFFHRHRDGIEAYYTRDNANLLRARTSDRQRRHILFIEDYLPQPAIGAGFPRSNDILHAMVEDLGLHVTVYPVFPPREAPAGRYRDLPDRAEIMWDRGIADLASFLHARPGYYDVLWIGRTHNAGRLRPILAACRAPLADCRIILDTEAVATLRERGRMQLEGRPDLPPLADMLRHEFRATDFVDRFVAVSPAEAELIAPVVSGPVTILGHVKSPHPQPRQPMPFAARKHFLFVGAIQTPDSPNLDALHWMNDQLLPNHDHLLPPESRITVAGHVAPGIDLQAILTHPRFDLLGAVEDLAPLYAAHRVFIAPTRFAAGLPYKIHDAAAHGIPIVATDLLSRQLGWHPGSDLACPPADHPEAFANAMARAYTDETLWTTLRRNAIHRIFMENRKTDYLRMLQSVIE